MADQDIHNGRTKKSINALIPWQKGQSGNPSGLPKGHKQHHIRLKNAIYAATEPHQVSDLMSELYKRAMDGNHRASQLWLEYTVGKPTQTVAITRDTAEPDDARARVAALLSAYPALVDRLLPEGTRIVKTTENEAAPPHAGDGGGGKGTSV